MIWQPKKPREQKDQPWKRCFAWLPVTLYDGRKAWLRFVERCFTTTEGGYKFQHPWPLDYQYYYRLPGSTFCVIHSFENHTLPWDVD